MRHSVPNFPSYVSAKYFELVYSSQSYKKNNKKLSYRRETALQSG